MVGSVLGSVTKYCFTVVVVLVVVGVVVVVVVDVIVVVVVLICQLVTNLKLVQELSVFGQCPGLF